MVNTLEYKLVQKKNHILHWHLLYADRYKNSCFSLLKVNNRIRHKSPMNAHGNTNSSQFEVSTMFVYIIYCTVVMAC